MRRRQHFAEIARKQLEAAETERTSNLSRQMEPVEEPEPAPLPRRARRKKAD